MPQNFSITSKIAMPDYLLPGNRPGSDYVEKLSSVFNLNSNDPARYWYREAYESNVSLGIGTPVYNYLLLRATEKSSKIYDQQIVIRGNTNFPTIEILYAPQGGISTERSKLADVPTNIVAGKPHSNYRSITGLANSIFPSSIGENAKFIRIAEHRDLVTSYNNDEHCSLTIMLSNLSDTRYQFGFHAGRIFHNFFAGDFEDLKITGDGILVGQPSISNNCWLGRTTNATNYSRASCILIDGNWRNLSAFIENTSPDMLLPLEGIDKPYHCSIKGYNNGVSIGIVAYTKYIRFFRDIVPHKSILISKEVPANPLERQAWIGCSNSDSPSNQVILWSIKPNSI
jgi:hypothetical protein